MKREIGWVERTDSGRREITVKIWGGRAYWSVRPYGGSEWDDTFQPDTDQWEELERLYRNRLQRGLGTAADFAVVQQRLLGELRGRPRQSEAGPSKKPGNAI